jgi:hypothetical protein
MSPRTPPPARDERRVNRPLREALDDLVGHTRHLAQRVHTLSPTELDYAQQRLQWLADEVWRAATGSQPPTTTGAP